MRNKVYKKTNGRCAYCGCTLLECNWHIDHLIPKARFHQFAKKVNYRVNDIENLLASCPSCNNYKTVFLLEDFRFELSQLVVRCNRHNAAYRIAKRFRLIEETNKTIIFYFETLESINNG